MKRYFMTIPESARLVLQASVIGKGGEVFILHMGEPVRILDLAETLITLSGFKPYEDIQIVETGMRPGEKLYEELRFETEETVPTSHPKIFINKLATPEPETVQTALRVLARLVGERNEDEVRRFLNGLLPEARLRSDPSPRERKKVKPNGRGSQTDLFDDLSGPAGDRTDQPASLIVFSEDVLMNSKH
jgi:FlaA1/EpsC-like NDP-sugar epimerase